MFQYTYTNVQDMYINACLSQINREEKESNSTEMHSQKWKIIHDYVIQYILENVQDMYS